VDELGIMFIFTRWQHWRLGVARGLL